MSRALLIVVLAGLTGSQAAIAFHVSPDPWSASSDTAVVRLLELELEKSTLFDESYSHLTLVDELIRGFYRIRDYRPIWIDGARASSPAMELIRTIRSSRADGLDPTAYRPEALDQVLAVLHEEPRPIDVVRAELELTRAWFQFAGAHLNGRVDPRTLSSAVYLDVTDSESDRVLEQWLSDGGSRPLRPRLIPQAPTYERLHSALERYRDLDGNGGWEAISGGDPLELGDRDRRVPPLTARLAAEGDLAPLDADNWVFNTRLQGALARFQQRHGLAADSILGPRTLAALNVPASHRVRQIEMAMERLRWLPTSLGDRHVMVNIPQFSVLGYAEGQLVLDMRVVVGADHGGKATPVFRDEMDHVVFNPYWNVPTSIVVEEMLPRIREDRSYLTRNHFEVLGERDEVISAEEVEIEAIASGAVRIRQRPGAGNALGLVKYMLPNPYGIYLHDTPADHLFSETRRDFSHGCIRLEDPVSFGEYVLGPEGWSRADVQAAIDAGERQLVPLATPIPVYIMYMTAFVDMEGTVSFREDIYGNDAALDQALTVLERRSNGGGS